MAFGKGNIGGGGIESGAKIPFLKTHENTNVIFKNLVTDSFKLKYICVNYKGSHLYYLNSSEGIKRADIDTGETIWTLSQFTDVNLPVNSDENLYFTDASTQKIYKYDETGVKIWEYSTSGLVSFNRNIFYDGDANLIFVMCCDKILTLNIDGNLISTLNLTLPSNVLSFYKDETNFYLLLNGYYKVISKNNGIELYSYSFDSRYNYYNNIKVKGGYVYVSSRSYNTHFSIRNKMNFSDLVYTYITDSGTSDSVNDSYPVHEDIVYLVSHRGVYTGKKYNGMQNLIVPEWSLGQFVRYITVDSIGNVYTLDRDGNIAKFEHYITII